MRQLLDAQRQTLEAQQMIVASQSQVIEAQRAQLDALERGLDQARADEAMALAELCQVISRIPRWLRSWLRLGVMKIHTENEVRYTQLGQWVSLKY